MFYVIYNVKHFFVLLIANNYCSNNLTIHNYNYLIVFINTISSSFTMTKL